MFEIVTKKCLGPKVFLMVIKAPLVANKAMPGQFLIVRADKDGERKEGGHVIFGRGEERAGRDGSGREALPDC